MEYLCKRCTKCPKLFPKCILAVTLLTMTFCLIMYWNGIRNHNSLGIYSDNNLVTFPAVNTEVDRTKDNLGRKRLPQAIIIGAMKCGTGALRWMMGRHPRVAAASGEKHFFDREEKYIFGLNWYRTKMPISTVDQVTIEKSPAYFVTPNVPERIHAMNASIRLLLVVRDPAVRALSEFIHVSSRKKQNITFAAFQKQIFNTEGKINESYRAVKRSRYVEHLRRWLHWFPLSQIVVLQGETLIESPLQVMTKVESFLNLPSYFRPWNFYFNKTKGFYCFRNEIMECMSSDKGRAHPKVDPVSMSRLRRYFAPFNERFYKLIGQRFNWPTR